jgi:hypothetical protein
LEPVWSSRLNNGRAITVYSILREVEGGPYSGGGRHLGGWIAGPWRRKQKEAESGYRDVSKVGGALRSGEVVVRESRT